MRTISEIEQQLPFSAEKGLLPQGVQNSRRIFGSNQLTPLPREPIWKKFIAKFDEPIIKILLAAALLSMIVDLFRASAVLGGIGMFLVLAAMIGATALRQGRWIPAIMFGSAILLFFVGVFTLHWLVEGMAVMIAVILATGVAFASEYKSDREFEILNARKESIQVKVIRDGEVHAVQMEDIAVGDIVSLEMGDEIPADGRVLKAKELQVDQALMTGESEPVRKKARLGDDRSAGPDQPACLYRGTQIVDGNGLMCVTEVGDDTYLGHIAHRLATTDEPAQRPPSADGGSVDGGSESEEQRVKQKLTISKALTPLQHKLKKLAGLISKVGYAAAILIFLAQLIYGVANHKVYFPLAWNQLLDVTAVLLDYAVNMVIIIVVAVPEGLPMSVTVSLALAMQKMTRANSLVRQLVACETIGSATVICSDKTGTLTQNKMRVEQVCWDGKARSRGTDQWVLPGAGENGNFHIRNDGSITFPTERAAPLDWMALNAALNSTANLEDKNGRLLTVGNTTEGALLQYLREGNIDYRNLRKGLEPTYQMHFSSERKRMTTVVRCGDQLVSLVKGAPEMILEHCAQYLQSDGTPATWTADAKKAVEKSLQDATVHAMRTLAFAYKILPADLPDEEDALHERREELETGMVFAGFVAIRDPLRDDVADAVEECRRAGIEVKLVTGDNVETARAIAHNIGLIDDPQTPINADDGLVLTSDKFNELSDAELKKRLPAMRILARAQPLDKYRLVRLLQDLGEVVAVTGDGTNDAPALKKADVGLAMGITGTEVAKEASEIVLLDDSFSTIVKAVHWGRSLYENIQRFLQFQLTINVSALTIFFIGVLIGVEAPFTVLQLLWINVIMDTFAAIALCSEPPRPGVMEVSPKRRDENILTMPMVRNILFTGAFFVVVIFGLLLGMRGSPVAAGWLGNTGENVNWSVETAGARIPIPKEELVAHVRGQNAVEAIPMTDPRATQIKPENIEKWTIASEAASVEPSLRDRECKVLYTVLQVSLFFSIYVFFQVWNQINCRSLTPSESGFYRIWQNPAFLAIACAVAIGQILIVTFGGAIFKVEQLGVTYWLGIIAFTSTVLGFAEIVRRIRLAAAIPPGQARRLT